MAAATLEPMPDTPPPRELTIDELAAETRVPSRTIRYYQSKKALPPPQRQGRKAVYGDEHVERLRLIAHLQDQGLTIKAIRDVLRRADRGLLELEDWLGLKGELQTPWADDQPRMFTRAELVAWVDDDRDGLVAALVEEGLVEKKGDVFLVHSPALLQVTARLDRAGIDLKASAEAARMLRRHLSRAAAEVSRHFLAHLGKSTDLSDPERQNQALATLRPVGLEVVQLIFAQEMEKVLRSAIESGKF